jgi:hypothetical protein
MMTDMMMWLQDIKCTCKPNRQHIGCEALLNSIMGITNKRIAVGKVLDVRQ